MNAQPTKEPGGKAGTKLGLRQPKPIPVDAVWITSKQLRARYGNLSEMWLWRKLRDDADFPQPRYNGHLKLFSVAALDAYDKKMATESPVKKKPRSSAEA
jgi:hypothetical protein